VRAYAATGDERYRSAFQMELLQTRSRDQAMAELRTLGSARTSWTASKAPSAAPTPWWWRWRTTSSRRWARKDFRTALSLAYGERYQRFKDAIMVPTRSAQTELETRLTEEGTRYSEMADQVRIVVFIAYASTSSPWSGPGLYIQRRVIGPVAILTDKTQRLLAGDKGVDFRAPGGPDRDRRPAGRWRISASRSGDGAPALDQERADGHRGGPRRPTT